MMDTAVHVLDSARFRALSGDPLAQAELIVFALCDALHAARGVYVPDANTVRANLARQARDARIRAEFNGRNYSDLADKHGLTSRTVRRILERK